MSRGGECVKTGVTTEIKRGNASMGDGDGE